MQQTRTSSFIEALINVLIGYSINFTANLVIFPVFGWHLSIKDNLIIGVFYTVISIVRSYVIRRWFNAHIHRLANKAAG